MMQRMLLMLILLLCFSAISASALYVGFDAGYSMNLMNTKTPWPMTEYKLGHGADLEFIFEYFPLEWLSINTGVRYVQKGFIYRETGMHNNGTTYTSTETAEMHHYLEIPLTIRFSFPVAANLKLFAGGGGYVGWWMFSNAFPMTSQATIVADTGIHPFDSTDNRFEAGLAAEAGCDILLAEDIRLLIAFRYLGGLTSTVKDAQRNAYHRYNDTFMLTIGARFGIGG